MNKRGQFFLIAALIIVTILIGLATIYTSTRTQPEQTKIYDLSNEINFETNKVIDYGVFNASSQNDIQKNVENFTKIYSEANPDSDILIVYGNKDAITGKIYSSTSTGSISVGTGGGQAGTGISTTTLSETSVSTTLQGGKIKVEVTKNESYEFDIKQGQTFYLVIKKQGANEQYVATK